MILFVPGGAFITDFEAADLFFLHRWVRETRATVAYVSYGYSPQAPYPRGQLQVLTAFRVYDFDGDGYLNDEDISTLIRQGLGLGIGLGSELKQIHITEPSRG